MAPLRLVAVFLLCSLVTGEEKTIADFKKPFKVVANLIVDDNFFLLRELTPEEQKTGVVNLEDPFDERNRPTTTTTTTTTEAPTTTTPSHSNSRARFTQDIAGLLPPPAFAAPAPAPAPAPARVSAPAVPSGRRQSTGSRRFFSPSTTEAPLAAGEKQRKTKLSTVRPLRRGSIRRKVVRVPARKRTTTTEAPTTTAAPTTAAPRRTPAAPAFPARAPVAPVRAPVAPARAPVAPARAPVAPVRAPVAPVRAPVTPARAPVAPVRAPVAPARAPVTPARTPVAPVRAPVAPARAPVAPARAPASPVRRPSGPAASAPSISADPAAAAQKSRFDAAAEAVARIPGTSRRLPQVERERENEINSLHRRLPGGSQTVVRDMSSSDFSCENRPYGYYADMQADCQVFHICTPIVHPDGFEQNLKHSLFCNNGTRFDQRTLTCREEAVALPCADSDSYYASVKFFEKFNIFDRMRAEDERRRTQILSRLDTLEDVAVLEAQLAQ